jgi:hypothetical protein
MVTRAVQPSPDPAADRLLRRGIVCVIVVACLGSGMLFLGLQYLIKMFHSARCPRGTFMVGGSSADIVGLLELFLAATLFITVSLWVIGLIAPAREFLDKFGASSDRDSTAKSYHQALLKGFAIATVVLAAITVPLGTIQVFDQFCLTNGEILNQDAPWAGLKAYRWSQVAVLATDCWRGKGPVGWGGDVSLTLDDGAKIRLSYTTADGDWARFYPTVAHLLHGGHFTFDTSDVESGCKAAELPMLIQRP